MIHEASTAAADPGMSAALRSVGLLAVPSSTPAGPSVTRLASTSVCASSLRTFMNNAGYAFSSVPTVAHPFSQLGKYEITPVSKLSII
jgi:hypothetical protein